MEKLKKYVIIFIVLVGTSFAVYATVIIPLMRNLYVNNITSTTARFHVECINTEHFNLYGKVHADSAYLLFDRLTVDYGDSGEWVECKFSIVNMQPDTPYYILIEAVGFEDPETGERLVHNQSIFLRTAE